MQEATSGDVSYVPISTSEIIGWPLFFESVGVVGDFGHSNVVDEDLNMQPDQNKGDVMGVGQVVLKM